VIHRDCPPSVEAYLQESGRAGRDGKEAEAYLLWGPDDDAQIRRTKTEADRQRIIGLLDYARNVHDCRREALLKLLDYDSAGDSPEINCCDVCDSKASLPDAAHQNTSHQNKSHQRAAHQGTLYQGALLREEKSLLEFFSRNKRRYTLGEAADTLSLAENIRWSADEAKLAIRELIKIKKLRVIKNYFWKDKLTISKN
jgi:ATP-dependent DNA helicase RecQ